MLIEFSATNFRSLADKQTLSLVANSSKEHRSTHVLEDPARGTPPLVRSAVVYGANASGKSNLISALDFVHTFVLGSASESQVDDPIDVTPFAFEGKPAPSEFEVLFVENCVRYQYGFKVTRSRVESEWLFAYPDGKAQRWFERKAEPAGGEPAWYFGPKLTGAKKTWQEATRPNALFLSTAVQLNSESLKPVFEWFATKLKIIEPYARVSPGFSARQCSDDEHWRSRVIEFLNRADLGIVEINVENRPFPESGFPTDMPEAVRKYLAAQMEGHKVSQITLSHRTDGGKVAAFDLSEESGGTQKAFALAGPWIDVLSNGYVLVIDELDTSLHPAMMQYLIGLFHDPEVNSKGAQLVFSTHDATILDRHKIRRDQVWFMEKDREQKSHLYPLTDFSPRKDENLGRGYLQGRYGALPFIAGASF